MALFLSAVVRVNESCRRTGKSFDTEWMKDVDLFLLFFFFEQLCEDINKHDGIVHPYTCSTSSGNVGYLHQGSLEIRSSPLLSSNLAPVSLATVENNDVTFVLVTCSFANLSADHASTLIPQFIKAILDLSLTERIICLADFSHHNHSPCKYRIRIL